MQNVYVIHDKTANTHGVPFYQPNDLAAIRMFRNEVNRAEPNNMLYLNPDDFTLIRIGGYNPEELTHTNDERVVVMAAIKLVNPKAA